MKEKNYKESAVNIYNKTTGLSIWGIILLVLVPITLIILFLGMIVYVSSSNGIGSPIGVLIYILIIGAMSAFTIAFIFEIASINKYLRQITFLLEVQNGMNYFNGHVVTHDGKVVDFNKDENETSVSNV